MKKIVITIFLILFNIIFSLKLLIPMDNTQNDHLKSYGFAYWVLKQKDNIDWLLNYKGGSFLINAKAEYIEEAKLRGISSRLTETPIRSAKAPTIGIKIITTGVLLSTLETTATGIRDMSSPLSRLPPLRRCNVDAIPSKAPVRTIASPTISRDTTVMRPGLAKPPSILEAFNWFWPVLSGTGKKWNKIIRRAIKEAETTSIGSRSVANPIMVNNTRASVIHI